MSTGNAESVVTAINKKFGAGTVMKLGAVRKDYDVQVIPTQSLRLNRALGVGGIPRGRIIEIYGPEGSGKSGIALGICAEAQKTGGKAAYIDVECALDPPYAEMLGINLNELYYVQPDSAEQALDIAEALIRSEDIDVVVIDSVAALVPTKELEGEMEDHTIGLQARLMSKALRKLTGAIAKSKTCCIFINQIREKVVSYGNPETTSGGRALRFYASVRIEARKGDTIKQGDRNIGHLVKCSIKKNKVAPPFQNTEYPVYYGLGIDKIDEIANVAVEEGIIKRAGAWFSYLNEDGEVIETPDGPRKWQGLERLKTNLREEPDFYQEIHDLVMAKIVPDNDIDIAEPIDSEEEVLH